jgi:hypothetical protein
MTTRFSGSNYFLKTESAPSAEHHIDDDLSIVASDDDDNSQSGLEGNHTSSTSNTKNAPADFVRRETRAVSFLRYFILILLLASAAGMCYGFYNLTTQADQAGGVCSPDDAEQAMDTYVQTLESNLQGVRSDRLGKAFTLSASFSSYVLESGVAQGGFPMQWPYVTIPHFEPRTIAPLASNDVTEVCMAPLVDPAERTQFETYAVLQQQPDCTFQGCQVVRSIYNEDGSFIRSTETTSPIWQLSPFDLVNPKDRLMNQFSVPAQANSLTEMIKKNTAVWSGFDFDFNIPDQSPDIFLFYPIFQDFKQVDIVGSISFRMNLKEHLAYAIPSPVAMETTIIVKSCGQAVFFAVFDTGLRYLGTVDMESVDKIKGSAETGIIELEPFYQYGQFENSTAGGESEKIVCPLEVIVAPVSFTEYVAAGGINDDNSSNRAIVVTSLVAVTFIIIIITFLIYDWLVERRQAVVINIANKSTAIVENLFPAQVRDRMLQDIEKKKSGGDGDQAVGDAGATPDPMAGTAAASASNAAPNKVSVKQFLTDQLDQGNDLTSQPIADLFPNTTVLFADIAGFTAWSSQRYE